MSCVIALLRGVNVGGGNPIAMAALKAMLAELGMADARTLLQSGNVVFAAKRQSLRKLEQRLEAETEKRFGASVDYFVRSAEEWRDVVAHNPFGDEARDDPGHLVVHALKAAPAAEHLRGLRAAIKGRETVAIWDRHAYVYFPDGIGDSKLTPRLLETHLATRATGRNWNTTLKLLALTEA